MKSICQAEAMASLAEGMGTFRVRQNLRLARLLVASGLVVCAAPALANDLDTELATLLEGHPQIRAAKENVESAQQAIGAARAGYLPTVNVNADTGPEHFNNAQLVDTFGAPLTREGYGGGVTVTQHLFDGHATSSAVASATDSKEVSESNLRVTRQNTVMEGINAFLDVQRQAKLVKLARSDEQRLQTQLHLEDERVQRGSGVAVDVLSAKHRLQLAKERRINYEGGLQQAMVRYQQVFGHAADAVGDTPPEPPFDMIPATLDEAVAVALNNNPNVESAKRTVTATQERTRAAQAGYYPTLDLVGKSDVGDNRDGNEGMSRDWEILLQLNWDLFSGFRTRAEVAQASYDYAASKDNAAQAERKTAEAVRIAWSQLETARERVAILENAVNLAYDVWEDRKKMRESGKATVIDVLDAESDITNAQITYLNANFDLKIAAYQVLLGLGRLEPGALDRSASAPASATSPSAK